MQTPTPTLLSMTLLLLAVWLTPLLRHWSLVLVVAGALLLLGRMRLQHALLFSGLALLAVFGRGSANKPTIGTPLAMQTAQTPAETNAPQPLDLKGITALTVRGFNGPIVVQAAADNTWLAQPKGQVRAAAPKRQGNTLLIEAEPAPPMGENGIGFVLKIQTGLALTLETSNGEIEVNGAFGDTTASTSNASIVLQGAQNAKLNLKTSNGQIEVQDLQNTTLQLETSNSNVSAENVTLLPGTQNRIASANGEIRIEALSATQGLRVSGKTSNGKIDIALPEFTVAQSDTSFVATQAGNNPATLENETSNADIVLAP